MAFSRYSRAPILNFGAQQGTSHAREAIQSAMSIGLLQTTTMVTRGRDRLDTISGEVYGDSRYWWILAAASGIGWGMQVPPGTIIKVPSLSDVANLVA